jgi:hypothetical protein
MSATGGVLRTIEGGPIMATQKEVADFIKANIAVDEVNENLFVTAYNLDGGRRQAVLILVSELMLVTSSRIAEVGKVSDSKVLEASGPIRPVWKDDEYYYTSKSMPLEDIDPSEIHGMIELTAFVGDELEKELGFSDQH